MTKQQAETLRRLLIVAEDEARRTLARSIVDRLADARQVIDLIETEG